MLHLFVCSNIFFTKDSGFHFYYFLVPTGALLLFELKEKGIKVSLSIIAALLFLYCENTLNKNPLIIFSEATNHLLYQSVFLVNMFTVIIVLTLFSKQIEKHQLELIKQASTDVLTGLYNRRFFFQQGENLLFEDNKTKQNFSLLLLDLDYFKKINDKYGHTVGDKCLVMVSQALQEVDSKSKFCTRIGGEEFAIVLPHCGPKYATKVAERIRVNIASLEVMTESDLVECTVSIGVSHNLTKTETLKGLLEQADIALYQAKNNGRNRVVLYQKQS